MLNNGILWMLLALFIPEILQFQVPYRIINGLDTLYHRSIPKLFIDDRPQQVANKYIYIYR